MQIVDNIDGLGIIALFVSDGMGLVRKPISLAALKTADDEWDESLLEVNGETIEK